MIFTASAGRMYCRSFNLYRLNFFRIYGVLSHLLKVLPLTPAAFASSDLLIFFIVKFPSVLHLERFRIQLAVHPIVLAVLGNIQLRVIRQRDA